MSALRATVAGPLAVALFGVLAVFAKVSQQREFDWQIDPLAAPAAVAVGWSAVHLARGRFGRALAMIPISGALVVVVALAWWLVVGAPWIFSDHRMLGAAYLALVFTGAGFAVGAIPLLFAWLLGVRERASD